MTIFVRILTILVKAKLTIPVWLNDHFCAAS